MLLMLKKYQYPLMGVLISLMLAYAYWQHEHSKKIIATVGQFEISKKEFHKEMLYRAGDDISLLNKEMLLEEMILKKLLLNKAYSDGLPSQEDIQREFNHLLMGKIRERYIEQERKNITISETELETFYRNNRELYRVPNKRELAILFLKKRMKDSDQEREQITQKLSQIITLKKEHNLPEASKGFGTYAIDYSEHQASRYRGGQLGWFTESLKVNWEQKVLDAGFKLKSLGSLSPIIETEKGYYLVRLMQETKEVYKAFNVVRGKVKHKLMRQKQQKVKDDFYKTLKLQFSIDIDHEKLNDFNTSVNSKKEKQPPMGLN